MRRSRRNFLIGLPILVAGVTAYRQRRKLASLLPRNQTRFKVLAFVRYPDHAAIIGEVYRHQYPKESSREMLMSRLSDYLAIDMSLATKSDIEQALLRTIKEDYKRGQTLLLDGWLLSHTEAVLAGLVADSRYN